LIVGSISRLKARNQPGFFLGLCSTLDFHSMQNNSGYIDVVGMDRHVTGNGLHPGRLDES
jgi:hypothetical protein